MPPKSKRADALAAAPAAKKAAAYLKRNGEAELAAAVTKVLGFALEAGRQQEAAAARDAGLDQPRSLQVTLAFRDHVHKSKTDVLPKVVTPYLERFLAGDWVPDRPQRAPRGSNPAKGNLMVRIDDDLWDRVDALAKDPAASEQRGYKLNAVQVAIGALRAEYGEPDTQ